VKPGPGQVRLRQVAAGLNYIDVYHRTGYYSQPLPFIPGLEGAGIVEAIGQAVRGLKVGDRVAYAGPAGGYSEVRLIEADRLVRLPLMPTRHWKHAPPPARPSLPSNPACVSAEAP
jgi:NADPH:quinone reductase